MTGARQIYDSDRAQLESLDGQLTDAFLDAVATSTSEGPLTIKANPNDDWEIRLSGMSKTELIGATAVRKGMETYTFSRSHDIGWTAPPGATMFLDTQFYNLVQLAIKPNLEWAILEPPK
jgi:hypothetical protein